MVIYISGLTAGNRVEYVLDRPRYGILAIGGEEEGKLVFSKSYDDCWM